MRLAQAWIKYIYVKNHILYMALKKEYKLQGKDQKNRVNIPLALGAKRELEQLKINYEYEHKKPVTWAEYLLIKCRSV